uniref:Microfibril associated protein 2 n=1 Tax=Xiphophorus couchianus TaxID=32473 RepID=A0A3B5L6E5_9TELE
MRVLLLICMPGNYFPEHRHFMLLRCVWVPDPTFETEPTEPGPLDCREEQYPCTRLYSVHKPCKQCLNSLCFYR